MTDIKMSEVFDLPMTSGKIAMGFYLNKDHCDEFCREAEFYREAEMAAKAINAYDDNQERIRQLESHAIDKSGSVGHKSKEATHREIDLIGELVNKYNSGECSVEDLHEHFRVTKVELEK